MDTQQPQQRNTFVERQYENISKTIKDAGVGTLEVLTYLVMLVLIVTTTVIWIIFYFISLGYGIGADGYWGIGIYGGGLQQTRWPNDPGSVVWIIPLIIILLSIITWVFGPIIIVRITSSLMDIISKKYDSIEELKRLARSDTRIGCGIINFIMLSGQALVSLLLIGAHIAWIARLGDMNDVGLDFRRLDITNPGLRASVIVTIIFSFILIFALIVHYLSSVLYIIAKPYFVLQRAYKLVRIIQSDGISVSEIAKLGIATMGKYIPLNDINQKPVPNKPTFVPTFIKPI